MRITLHSWRPHRWATFARRLTTLTAALLLALSLPAAAPGQPPTSAPSPAPVPAYRQAKNVAVVTIKGPIDTETARSFKRRLDDAAAGGAEALVVELDTPGGEVGAARDICEAIKASAIPNTVAWVRPNAISAGAIIALACREIVVADRPTFGDAGVIAFNPLLGIQSLPELERQKLTAPLLVEVVNSARVNGYDEKLVQGFVTLGVELWAVQNTKTPGQLLFIDRAEFKMLFGTEPTQGEPTTALAAPPIPEGAKPEQLGDSELLKRLTGGDQNKSGKSGFRRGRNEPPPTPGPIPTTPEDPAASPFIPASPNLAPETAGQITNAMRQPSARPVLTAADQGQWKLIEKVSDGRAFFTFREPELFRYGLATRAATKAGTINTDQELKAHFGATNLARLEPSLWENLAGWLGNSIVKGILIVIFLLGLFVEMTNPGTILPGTVAAAALLLILAPPLLLGLANWWTVVAVLAGITLIALEIFVLPSFGVFGILGLLLLFGGLVGTFIPSGGQSLFPNTPEATRGLIHGLTTVVLSTATAGVGMYFLSKNIGSIPLFGKLVLREQSPGPDDAHSILGAVGYQNDLLAVGREGVAVTTLRPSGRARFGEHLADVVAEMGIIEAGQTIRIVSSSPFRISVEPTPGSDPAPRAQPNPPGPDGPVGGVVA